MDWAGSMNIVFHADLSSYVAHRPSVPVLDHAAGRRHRRHRHGPGADGAPVGRVADRLGLRHQRAAAGGRRGGRHARRAQPRRRRHDRRHAALDVAVGQQQDVRHALRRGPRVLHGRRLPPAPAEQRPGLEHLDRRRLQPGLEARARARRARPAPSLLDSYDAERAPIGRQIVLRANQSIEEFGPIFDALGLLDTADPEQMRANMEVRKENSPGGARGAAQAQGGDRAQELRVQRAWRGARAALPLARWCRTARRSRSTRAIRSSTTTRPRGRARGSRTPGSSTAAKVSTHDLAGKGRFTLLTGIGGEAWAEAAADVTQRTGRADRGVRDRSRRATRTTSTTTGRGRARSRSRAACWCAPTRTSRGARTRWPRTRRRSSGG